MEPPIRTYSPQWYAMRTTHVGASEIGALMGLSPFQDAAAVWDSKHNPEHLQPDDGVNTRMWWGHKEEPAIIEAAIALMYPVSEPPPWVFTGDSWFENGFMVSPDAVLCDRFVQRVNIPKANGVVIEAKTVGLRSAPYWKEGPPLHVYAQVHAQMTLLDAQSGVIAARICGDPVRIWPVKRIQGISQFITNLVADFWRYKEKPAHWDAVIHSMLRSIGWEKEKPQPVSHEIDLEQVSLLAQWTDAKKEAARAQKLADVLHEEVRELFAESDGLTFMGNTLAVAEPRERVTIDTTALALDHPDIYEQYKKVSEFRVYQKTPNLEGMR